jgi:hypothetical protein
MPWKSVVPESATPLLRPVQQLFVGVVLMIHRAPSRVRTVSFARAVERWIEEVVSAVPEKTEFSNAPEIQAPIREDPIYADLMVVNPTPPPAGSVKSAVTLFTDEEETPIEPTLAPEPPVPVVLVEESDSVVETEETPEPFVAPNLAPLNDVTIETELGGLFYLLNLALFMEIDSNDDFSIWDFVEIVGKEIDHENIDDAIWELLRNFAGRDDEDELITPPWLADLLPHIRARLHLALGIDDDLASILLYHHAKISITPTHAHVFFSLADHPIEIRLSGLDRNPGWVPDAGRFITFHYD